MKETKTRRGVAQSEGERNASQGLLSRPEAFLSTLGFMDTRPFTQRDERCEMGETSEPRVFSPNNHKKEESDRGASDTFPPTSTTTLACEPGHKSTGMLKECQGRGPPAPLQQETLKSQLSRQLPQRQSPHVQQNSAEWKARTANKIYKVGEKGKSHLYNEHAQYQSKENIQIMVKSNITSEHAKVYLNSRFRGGTCSAEGGPKDRKGREEPCHF